MFRSSTIIRELALNLNKVIFMLKHSVKLRRYAARMHACMLQHNRIIIRRNFTECFNINITLTRFSASSLMMVDDRNM